MLPKLINYSDEEWRELGREEQIRLWRNLFERSSRYTTPFELCFMVLMRMTTEDLDIDGWLASCPLPLLKHLKETVQHCPADDDEAGWDGTVFHIAAYYGAVSKDEYLEIKRKEKANFRMGVKLYRLHAGQL